mmetsp:Transcript_2504/g.9671  ORF Transcript_2504/g.9671 Transcript_2504/m.9671 type:complete len:215 (-) Transcript_2504:258-902(-)
MCGSRGRVRNHGGGFLCARPRDGAVSHVRRGYAFFPCRSCNVFAQGFVLLRESTHALKHRGHFQSQLRITGFQKNNLAVQIMVLFVFLANRLSRAFPVRLYPASSLRLALLVGHPDLVWPAAAFFVSSLAHVTQLVVGIAFRNVVGTGGGLFQGFRRRLLLNSGSVFLGGDLCWFSSAARRVCVWFGFPSPRRRASLFQLHPRVRELKQTSEPR